MRAKREEGLWVGGVKGEDGNGGWGVGVRGPLKGLGELVSVAPGQGKGSERWVGEESEGFFHYVLACEA